MLKCRTFGAFNLLTIKSCARHGFRDFVMKQKMHILVLFLIFSLGIHAQTYEQCMDVLYNCNKVEVTGVFKKNASIGKMSMYDGKEEPSVKVIIEYKLDSKDLGGWLKWHINGRTQSEWFYKKTTDTDGASISRKFEKVNARDTYYYFYNNVTNDFVAMVLTDDTSRFEFIVMDKENRGKTSEDDRYVSTIFQGGYATFYNKNGGIILSDYFIGKQPIKSANLMRVFLDNMFEFLQ